MAKPKPVASALDIRKKNLRALIAQWGGPTQLARKLKHSGPSYLPQLVGEGRPITEKAARKIEELLGLPNGWLDSNGKGELNAAQVDDKLIVQVVMAVGAALTQAGVNLPPSKFSEVVVLVYEEASRSRVIDEAFINRIVKLIG